MLRDVRISKVRSRPMPFPVFISLFNTCCILGLISVLWHVLIYIYIYCNMHIGYWILHGSIQYRHYPGWHSEGGCWTGQWLSHDVNGPLGIVLGTAYRNLMQECHFISCDSWYLRWLIISDCIYLSWFWFHVTRVIIMFFKS